MKSQAAWLYPAALTLFLFAFGPFAAYLHLVAPFHGFLAFAASMLPGIVAIVLGVVMLIKGRTKPGLTSVAAGCLPLLVIGIGIAAGSKYPRINDISSNLDSPPVITANTDKDPAYPEDFKSQVRAAYPDLASLPLPLPPAAAYQLIEDLAKKHPHWRIVKSDPAAGTLEGEDTAGLFQFTDDFVIRVTPVAATSQVDMRSRSRNGKGDFGVNAGRIREFFAEIASSVPVAGGHPDR